MTINVDDYLELVTMFHRQRPKFMGALAATLQPIIDAYNFLETIPREFDLDYAIGVQLDVVGEWINLSRKFNVPLPNPWFTWGDDQRGWGRGIWYQPFDYDYLATFLDDETYRTILRARIRANQWDEGVLNIRSIMDQFFAPQGVQLIVDDHQTMENVIAITNWIPSALMLEIFRGEYLPLSPSGVRTYKIVTSLQNVQIFGWGLDNNKIGGWGTGTWGVDPMTLIQSPPRDS